MNITLTETDMEDAVRLYIANSGVHRSVSHLEFARKLKGDDAGITVTLELADEPLSPEYLETLALDVATARDINTGPASTPAKAEPKAKAKAPKPAPAVKEPEPEPETVEFDEDESDSPFGDASAIDDEDIPFDTEEVAEEPAEVVAEEPAEEEEEVDPFAQFADEDEEEESPEPVAAKSEEDEGEGTAAVYAAEAVDDPFAEETVTPIELDEEDEDPANLFG
jgi:hypothetical protein